jgi:recombination protein RecT
MTDKAVAKTTSGIPALLTDAVEQFRRALPAHMSAERFTRVALTVFRTNPQLQRCNPESFLGAMMQAAQLGLEPGMGDQVYLIPYGKEVTLQYGYRGLLELARRSGEIQFVTVQEVRTEDEFSYSFGSDQHLRHKPAAGERGEPTHYYAFLKYKDGGEHFDVMSVSDVAEHKKRFVKQEGPAWKSAPDAMAKKTVLRAALKYAPSSVEKSSQTAIGSESRSIRVIDGDLQVGQVFDEPDAKSDSISELDGGQDGNE